VLRAAPPILAALGAALLIWAELSPLYHVQIGAVVKKVQDVGPHHDYALMVVAVAALAMAWGVWKGGSRPALIALMLLGLVALFVTLVVDRPDTHAVGIYNQLYTEAKATPLPGYTRELAGGAILVLAGAAGWFTLPRRGD
jgi:hypothetical protein